MVDIMIGLCIGVTGSLLATILWYYLFDPIKCSFSYSFTPVSGIYKSSYPDHPDWPPEIINVKQLGFHIKGEMEDSETKEKYIISGKTVSRVVTYIVRPQNRRLNEYSAGLVRMKQDGKNVEGYVVYLTEDNELPEPVKVVLTKIDG